MAGSQLVMQLQLCLVSHAVHAILGGVVPGQVITEQRG